MESGTGENYATAPPTWMHLDVDLLESSSLTNNTHSASSLRTRPIVRHTPPIAVRWWVVVRTAAPTCWLANAALPLLRCCRCCGGGLLAEGSGVCCGGQWLWMGR